MRMTYTDAFLKLSMMSEKDFVKTYNRFVLNCCGADAEAYIYNMRDFTEAWMKTLGGHRLSVGFDFSDHYWWIDCAGCARSSSIKAEMMRATDCIEDMLRDMMEYPEKYEV